MNKGATATTPTAEVLKRAEKFRKIVEKVKENKEAIERGYHDFTAGKETIDGKIFKNHLDMWETMGEDVTASEDAVDDRNVE